MNSILLQLQLNQQTGCRLYTLFKLSINQSLHHRRDLLTTLSGFTNATASPRTLFIALSHFFQRILMSGIMLSVRVDCRDFGSSWTGMKLSIVQWGIGGSDVVALVYHPSHAVIKTIVITMTELIISSSNSYYILLSDN